MDKKPRRSSLDLLIEDLEKEKAEIHATCEDRCARIDEQIARVRERQVKVAKPAAPETKTADA